MMKSVYGPCCLQDRQHFVRTQTAPAARCEAAEADGADRDANERRYLDTRGNEHSADETVAPLAHGELDDGSSGFGGLDGHALRASRAVVELDAAPECGQP